MTEGTTEFEGFLFHHNIIHYPLPEGSPADDSVKSDDQRLFETPFFTFDEELGLYQIRIPLSSAMPETGTFTREEDVITAVSYDGTQSHTLHVLDEFAMELTESTNWEHLVGRVFTARYDKSQTFGRVQPEMISDIICNGWEITLDDAQMAEFVEHLYNVTSYQFVPPEAVKTGGSERSLEFTLNEVPGRPYHYRLDRYYHADKNTTTSFLLEQSSCDALYAFLAPFVEQARLDWEEDAKALPYQSNVTYGTPAEELSLTIGQGNYTIECSDGRTESGIYYIKDGILYCVYGEEAHEFAVVDDYTIELQKTTQFGEFVGSQLTCRLHPVQPFAELTEDTIVIAQYLAEEIALRITPDTAIMTAFVDALQKLVIYDNPLYSVTPETTDLSQATEISITREDGTTELDIADYLLLDGVGYVYDTASAADLLDIINRFRNGEFME
jgi:hypothetical protein